MTLVYGSVCSGIEAATAAWHPLGWKPSFFSEIEKFPRAVLQHHYPEVPLHGDFTTIQVGQYEPIDLLVGGTPCQSFSIAGLRGGLDDERGNLALEYLRLADRLRPRWLVWENVPGVLSSNGGRDFGSILGGMVELGYGVAYRVLDAQYVRVDGFGRAVPQRRRRVFVVGYLGDWRRAAAVLLERHSMSGSAAPLRKAGQVAAALTANGVGTCRADDNQAQANHLIATYRMVAFGEYSDDGSASTVKARDHKDATDLVVQPVAFDCKGTQVQFSADGSHPTLRAMGHSGSHANAGGHAAFQWGKVVLRLTPTECEKLQGFPDGWTDIRHGGKPTPDGPRYKALGNSMAVNVMRWIGERIQMAESMAPANQNSPITQEKAA